MRSFLQTAVSLFAAAYLFSRCLGCAEMQARAVQAKVVDDYVAELDRCKAVGKASGSLAVYNACADAVDRTVCAEKGWRCQAVVNGGAKP
jgi:hypothetical protein